MDIIISINISNSIAHFIKYSHLQKDFSEYKHSLGKSCLLLNN